MNLSFNRGKGKSNLKSQYFISCYMLMVGERPPISHTHTSVEGVGLVDDSFDLNPNKGICGILCGTEGQRYGGKGEGRGQRADLICGCSLGETRKFLH